MDANRFARLREIVAAAGRLPPAEREPYLGRVCAGDEDLLREARSLLDVDPDEVLPPVARTGGVARIIGEETGADGGASGPFGSVEASPESRLPERIGSYRILGILGEGGAGVVYRAEQDEPIHREVALKLIPAAPGQRSVLNRFEAERSVLALLEHPGIARVLDAGHDDADRPYIVMELVRGRSITEFCRAGGLGLRERLRLFVEVCAAVQYAHQKGIIHRDLKPSNILVTRLEGNAVPKIIDFGIAKIEEDLGLTGTVTRVGQIMGTLDYMSPEQAAGRAREVDTRSDVYSLGVLLHELVFNALPYDLRDLPLTEAVRVILETSPASLRGSVPAGAAADRELVSVIEKALEKEPDRRYPGVAAFADDVKRYLDGHPVLAHPPSSLYHLKKLVSRNRTPFTLAAALFLLALSSAAVMGVLLETRTQEQIRARREADRAEHLSSFLRGMLSSVESRGREATVLEVLDNASRDIDGSRLEPAEEAAIRSTLGSAYSTLREYEKAQAHLEKSLEMNRAEFGEKSIEYSGTLVELSELHFRWTYSRRSRVLSDSLARRALAIRREILGPDAPLLAEPIVQVARIAERGAVEADSLFGEALRLLRGVPGQEHQVGRILRWRALPLFQMNKRREAQASLREALAIGRRLHSGDDADIFNCLHDLAFVVEDPAEKESLFVEHLAMGERLWGPDHPSVIEPLASLGGFYLNRGYLDKSEPHLRKALEIAVATYDADHEEVARQSNNLAALLRRQGKHEEAARLLKSALRTWTAALGPANNGVIICRGNLARTLVNLGRYDEARALYQEGLAASREAYGEESGPVAFYLGPLAGLLIEEGRYREAETCARRAVRIWRYGQERGGNNYPGALTYLGSALNGQGRLEDAAEAFRAADSLYMSDGYLRPVGLPNRVLLGDCLRKLGLLDEADTVLARARTQYLEELGEEDRLYPNLLLACAELQADRKAWTEAERLVAEARRLLVAVNPGDARLERANALADRCRAARSVSHRTDGPGT